jgi:2-oxoglutarate ferredoxin oxidoreductase subunit alpha
VLSRFEQILVPELNLGQLTRLLRSEFLVDAHCLGKVEGQPFRVEEIRHRIDEMLRGED